MGSVCNPHTPLDQTDQGPKKESIHIQAQQSSQHIDFSFTTDKLIHISADLLIIFLDHSVNIRKNDHFIKLPLQAAKLEQYARAKLDKSKNGSHAQEEKVHYVTFPIMIPTLNYKQVSLIFCDIWEDSADFKLSFSTLLNNYFHSIETFNFKSVVVSEFTSELGIPLQRGIKTVVNQSMRLKAKPEKIQFCCLGEDSKLLLCELIEKNKDALADSFTSSRASLISNYI